MTTATLTPYATGKAAKVGRRVYRKQILPLGTINYKGQKITFDKAYLTDLAKSFKAGAYDQVPFVLADTENRHNMDPERFRGHVKTLELTADGLDAIVAVSKQGAKVLEENPNLGVSARLVEGLAKADGRKFKRAVQHVLGTMDPRVTGLRPWQAVDLSSEDADIQVVDLTTATYEEGTQDMSKTATTKPEADQPLDLSTLSDEDFDALIDMAEDDEDGDEPTDPPAPTTTTTTTTTPPVVAAVPDADDDDDDEDDDDDVTNLSVVTQQTRDEVTQMRIDLAAEKFKSEKKDLIRAGVPPFILDLAEPILSSPDATVIDLSNSDEPVNATEVVRKIVEGMKGMIDIKPEIGHQVDLSTDEDDEEDALMKQWDTEYGQV